MFIIPSRGNTTTQYSSLALSLRLSFSRKSTLYLPCSHAEVRTTVQTPCNNLHLTILLRNFEKPIQRVSNEKQMLRASNIAIRLISQQNELYGSFCLECRTKCSEKRNIQLSFFIKHNGFNSPETLRKHITHYLIGCCLWENSVLHKYSKDTTLLK